MAALLQTLRQTRASLAVPGTALQVVVRTERQPWVSHAGNTSTKESAGSASRFSNL